jgi:hypothetical protein
VNNDGGRATSGSHEDEEERDEWEDEAWACISEWGNEGAEKSVSNASKSAMISTSIAASVEQTRLRLLNVNVGKGSGSGSGLCGAKAFVVVDHDGCGFGCG